MAGLALAILVINLPFGFWRAGVRKPTPPWFLAAHASVPLVIGLRVLSGLGWHLSSVPVLVSAFFAGQFLGEKLRYWRKGTPEWDPSNKDSRPFLHLDMTEIVIHSVPRTSLQ